MVNNDWQTLTMSAVGQETRRWLAEWRWLVPDVPNGFSPLWLNAFGDWTLMADWVVVCKARGMLLSHGQCYGWKVAPVIGGKLEFENVQAFDIAVYECIMGQVHRQVQGMPEGYVITEFKMGR